MSQIREGTILVFLAPTHGITEADLLVPAVIGGAGLGWLLVRFQRNRHRENSARVFLP